MQEEFQPTGQAPDTQVQSQQDEVRRGVQPVPGQVLQHRLPPSELPHLALQSGSTTTRYLHLIRSRRIYIVIKLFFFNKNENLLEVQVYIFQKKRLELFH